MVKLRLSAKAERDLEAINAEGIEIHGAATSARYMAGFDKLFDLLRRHPLAGQARPEFRQTARVLPHRPYRLLYRIVGDTVVIDRILHQARDVRRALQEGH